MKSKSCWRRVAAVQYAVGSDVATNLARALHWLEEAGRCQPDLVVLPEFANHCSWYDDAAHCWQVAVDLDGDFLKAIAGAAARMRAHVVINVTLRREAGVCTGSSLLYAPSGERLAVNDKQVLIGHENQFLRRARTAGPIVDTPVGQLGLYACMDGVVMETPRVLALRGAQVLCNSLNSFASDEGSLHIPVRAAENRVFVVAANKVGPLIPEPLLEPVSQQTGIPVRFLNGAGESQIVAPDGRVLAIAPRDEEALIWADINLAEVGRSRPDGSDVIAARRPALYTAITQDPATQPEPAFTGAAALSVAAIQLPGTGRGALDAALTAIEKAVAQGARYLVLPENAFAAPQDSRDEALAATSAALAALPGVCGPARVAFSGWAPQGADLSFMSFLVDASGVRLGQPLLHGSRRHAGAVLGDQLETLLLDDAHVAVLSGDDALHPEIGRLLAMRGVDLWLVPCAPLEAWELGTGLVERAAENRINLVAACQPGPCGTSLIASLQKDFTVMTPWTERAFDGLLSQPVLTRAAPHAGLTLATVHPAHAANKVVSLGTDLVRGRAWHLAAPLLGDAQR